MPTPYFSIRFIAFFIFCLQFAISISLAQEQKQLTEQQVTEILTAFKSSNNTMILEASKKLKNVEPIPTPIAKQLIQFYWDPYLPAKRIASNKYMRKVKFDEKLVGLLLETLAAERFENRNFSVDALKKYLTQPGRKIIPILHAACVDKDRHAVAREIPFAALMEFDNLPDAVTRDFPDLLKIPGGQWSEAAYWMAENGKSQALVSLLESENNWQSIRAAGALEKYFPGRYTEALDKLIEIAFDSENNSFSPQKNNAPVVVEATTLLAKAGFQNTYLILQLGLNTYRSGKAARSALVQMLNQDRAKQTRLKKILPILKAWSKQKEKREGVLLWYGRIGIENEGIFADLINLIKSSDEEYSQAILKLFRYRYDDALSLKAADELLRHATSRKFAFQLLNNIKHKCGSIAPTIIHRITQIELNASINQAVLAERAKLYDLMDCAKSLPIQAGIQLIELATKHPSLRGKAIAWLEKCEDVKNLNDYAQLLKHNNCVVGKEFSGTFYSKEHRLTKQKTKRASFSYDGSLLAVVTEKQLKIIDTTNDSLTQNIELPSSIHNYFEPEFDHSGKYIALKFRDSASYVWNVRTGDLVTKTTDSAIQFLNSPDHAVLIDENSNENKEGRNLHSLKLPSFEITSTVKLGQRYKFLPSVSSVGNKLLICTHENINRSTILILEIRKANSLDLDAKLKYPVKSFSNPSLYATIITYQLSHNGEHVALLHNHGIIDVLRTSDLTSVASHQFVDNNSSVSYLRPTFSRSGDIVAYSTSRGFVRLWNFERSENVQNIKTRKTGEIHFSKDGRWIIQSNYKETNTVAIASTTDPEKTGTMYVEGETLSVKPLSDGKLFEIATDKKMLLIDSSKFEELFRPLHLTDAELKQK